MGKTPWTALEVAWLYEQLPAWSVARVRETKRAVIHGRSRREEFLHRIVRDFLAEFSTRQWIPGDARFKDTGQHHAWHYKKLEEWLKNHSRRQGGRVKSDVPKLQPTITARQLALRECNAAIQVKAAEI
ncbi:hypothetical protein FS749_013473 [Ceratobasidium sp. UAMH 11750]|nr:hypothetical protein FS749_013473 [Ceratobasidium sp. UAMH 11750]